MYSIVFVVAVALSSTVVGYPQFNSFDPSLSQNDCQENPFFNEQFQMNQPNNDDYPRNSFPSQQNNNDDQFQFNPNNPFFTNPQNGNRRQNPFDNNSQNNAGQPSNQFQNNPFSNLNQNNQIGGDDEFISGQGTRVTRAPQDVTPSPIPTSRPNQVQATTQPNLPGGETTTANAVPGAETQRTPCEQRCAITPQYNPVCGTDGETYTSTAQLQCAQRCGITVQVRHIGACARSG